MSDPASPAPEADRAARARSFGAVAREYDRLRPPPVPEAVAWCLPPGARRVLDLAAGTGLMTRALLAAGVDVVAVEPDDDMRAVLRERSPRVEALAGVGEDVPLPDASVDAVVVSSAWHWMDPERATREVARVLRDGGRFAVLWTGPDREVGWVRDLRVGAQPQDPGSAARHHRVDLPAGAPFAGVETTHATAVRPTPRADLLALIGTYSGAITRGPGALAAAQERAEAVLAERFGTDEVVELPVRSRCWRAHRVPREG